MSAGPEHLEAIANRFRQLVSGDSDWSLRLVAETGESLNVRRHVTEPLERYSLLGAFVAANHNGSSAYAATSDLTGAGLQHAFDQARQTAEALAPLQLIQQPAGLGPQTSGSFQDAVEKRWSDWLLPEKLDYLQAINRLLALDPAIVDWSAGLTWHHTDTLLAGPDNHVRQTHEFLSPTMTVVANHGVESQVRTYAHDQPARAGLEHLDRIGFAAAAERIAGEALELLRARECPTERCDLLLMPSQMMLQIHESIGHPLELDRILGDERNYAGTSFVQLQDFGTLRYGSELLNAVFDPGIAGELASYACDDDGTPARREYLIKDGVLVRPLGGRLSQSRAQIHGVANARSSGWNRPPIDRMANINLEPGNNSFTELLTGIEYGVLMDTNRSWSIDDSRNKFQFGCEYARLIENGELTSVLKNPNYRGISADFWRNLKAVGDHSTWAVHGVHTCGKGEPNQALNAGHAAPVCLFSQVEVFGGD